MKAKGIQLIIAVLVAMLITGCEKWQDEVPAPPPPANETEVITTVRMVFLSAGGTELKNFLYYDADGDGGGVAPIIMADALTHDTVYFVSLLLLDQTKSPADTISNAVLEEGTDHQFFFQPSGATITFAYADVDADGRPIGLQSVATAGPAAKGTLKVTLIHQGDKSAPGASSGDITNVGGETDVEVDFPLVIQ